MNPSEQAAKRLAEMQRAGIDVSGTPTEAIAVPHTQIQPISKATTDETSNSDPTPSRFGSEQAAPDRRSKDVKVDLIKMREAGLLVPGSERSSLEEEFRIVKRPVLENVRGHGAAKPDRANLIMVTSSLHGERKTPTSITLAISMALELDHTVLLVEADVVKPSVLSRIGVKGGKGLLDLLEDPKLDLADVLLKTDIPKLTLLPAGSASSRSTELLASATMDALLDELANNYHDRIIIFDSPPLLPST